MTNALAAMGQAGIAQSQRAAQDVQEQSQQIDSLKRSLHPTKDKSKKLREACEGFESVFIQKMWEQMRATVPKGGLLQGRDEQYWQGMFDQELSKKMSSAGGIGLADMMYEQLSRNLVSASRTTASGQGAASKNAADGSAAGTGFVVSAAPLLPPADSAAAQSGGMYSAEIHQPEAEHNGDQRQSTDTALVAQASQQAGQQAGGQVGQAGQAGQQAGQQASQQAGGASPLATTPNAQASSTPPEVQQVLEQLRAQTGQPSSAGAGGVGGVGSTMTGAQAIAAVQSMTPAQALALSQGMSWAQVQNMTGPAAATATGAAAAMGASLDAGMLTGQPPMTATGQPSMAAMQGMGLDAARNAAQLANTRMPSGGVLPPMTPLQRQSQIQYSAAKVAGNGASSHSKGNTSAATAAPVLDSTMPANPVLHSNVQGNPGVSPSQFVQNSSLIPPANNQPNGSGPNAGPTMSQGAGTNTVASTNAAATTLAANTAPMSMTAEQIAAMSAASPADAAQGTNPAIPSTAQEPQVINNTFTTNIPPNRRNSRQGQRMPRGAAIRTLNAG